MVKERKVISKEQTGVQIEVLLVDGATASGDTSLADNGKKRLAEIYETKEVVGIAFSTYNTGFGLAGRVLVVYKDKA